MVHERIFSNAAQENSSDNDFEAAARAHVKSLEDAGGTPEQIVRQLADVVASYATGGLDDEASALREFIRQYQLKWKRTGLVHPKTNAG
ncbi:hypothetical protein [Microvirga arabica]|uniref:hypothetical protein n=1 Tax=Microvirga arabica TaxID=1128671 RepID=UPI00193A63EB|nr:hypothetical protein [Microvirga arabica]MBM1169646.1 hypothetical protein [Microvirga arabica]